VLVEAGKTTLMTRYARRVFLDRYIPTIGVEFELQTLVLDGKRIKMQIVRVQETRRVRSIEM
jgi:GTPase SAR1 family protein